jgi:hypothetical protein
MSSYLNDNDGGNVHLEFRDGGGNPLGTAQISDPDFGPDNVWSLTQGGGLVPVGTATIRVSLFGTPRNAGADGYIDNVDVQITDAANILLFAQVNTDSGQVSLRNATGEPVQIDYYEISSASDALNENNWNSLQEQNVAGFPAGNGSGNGWEEAGGSDDGLLSESFLTGNSTVANGANVSLGQAFKVGGAHDLVFRYAVVPESSAPTADFDADGDVDGSDFLRWQRGLGTSTGATKGQGDADGDGDVDAGDLAAWEGEFGGGGFSGPGVLQTGFIRYVTVSTAAVPEPSTVILVGLGLTALACARPPRGGGR